MEAYHFPRYGLSESPECETPRGSDPESEAEGPNGARELDARDLQPLPKPTPGYVEKTLGDHTFRALYPTHYSFRSEYEPWGILIRGFGDQPAPRGMGYERRKYVVDGMMYKVSWNILIRMFRSLDCGRKDPKSIEAEKEENVKWGRKNRKVKDIWEPKETQPLQPPPFFRAQAVLYGLGDFDSEDAAIKALTGLCSDFHKPLPPPLSKPIKSLHDDLKKEVEALWKDYSERESEIRSAPRKRRELLLAEQERKRRSRRAMLRKPKYDAFFTMADEEIGTEWRWSQEEKYPEQDVKPNAETGAKRKAGTEVDEASDPKRARGEEIDLKAISTDYVMYRTGFFTDDGKKLRTPITPSSTLTYDSRYYTKYRSSNLAISMTTHSGLMGYLEDDMRAFFKFEEIPTRIGQEVGVVWRGENRYNGDDFAVDPENDDRDSRGTWTFLGQGWIRGTFRLPKLGWMIRFLGKELPQGHKHRHAYTPQMRYPRIWQSYWRWVTDLEKFGELAGSLEDARMFPTLLGDGPYQEIEDYSSPESWARSDSEAEGDEEEEEKADTADVKQEERQEVKVERE